MKNILHRIDDFMICKEQRLSKLEKLFGWLSSIGMIVAIIIGFYQEFGDNIGLTTKTNIDYQYVFFICFFINALVTVISKNRLIKELKNKNERI